jgi:hypothetical protein
MWLRLSRLAKRLGALVAVLADPAKHDFGLGIFDLLHLEKKCGNLYRERWLIFNSKLNDSNLDRILPENKWCSINAE